MSHTIFSAYCGPTLAFLRGGNGAARRWAEGIGEELGDGGMQDEAGMVVECVAEHPFENTVQNLVRVRPQD